MVTPVLQDLDKELLPPYIFCRNAVKYKKILRTNTDSIRPNLSASGELGCIRTEAETRGQDQIWKSQALAPPQQNCDKRTKAAAMKH